MTGLSALVGDTADGIPVFRALAEDPARLINKHGTIEQLPPAVSEAVVSRLLFKTLATLRTEPISLTSGRAKCAGRE